MIAAFALCDPLDGFGPVANGNHGARGDPGGTRPLLCLMQNAT